MHIPQARRLAPMILLAAALACGGGAGSDAATTDEVVEEAPAAETAAPLAEASAPVAPQGPQSLTVEDIDRWARGMAAELQAVNEAGERMRAARTGEDTLSAMTAMMETSTVEAGAKAAGVDVERYRMIGSTLNGAAATLVPAGSELGMDTTQMPPEVRAQFREARERKLAQLREEVPAPVLEALEPRAAELRKQSLELAFTRVKAAGG